jgi:CheY-like chemotaxis protein
MIGRDRPWRYSAWGKHPIEPLSFRCIILHCDSMKKDKIQVFKDTIPFSAVEHKNPARRILVVDDDPDTRQLSIDVLVSSEYEVDAARDGAAGWEALRAKHYDLVITDNKMPKMTGVELIEKLRYTRVGLPVIMATSQLPMDIFVQKPWLTPDAALQRPFSNDDLLATVKKVLRADDSNVAHMGMLLPKYL